MEKVTIYKAVLMGSTIIGAAILLGSLIISRAPRFEKTGTLEIMDTRSGAVYELQGAKNPGQPFYKFVPGRGLGCVCGAQIQEVDTEQVSIDMIPKGYDQCFSSTAAGERPSKYRGNDW